uniref:hypothetical protein n=1 Tax=Mycobacterium TaxID=1763 RepID=UPI00195E98D7
AFGIRGIHGDIHARKAHQRGIADVLGCSRNTVASVFAAATAAGVGFGEVADLAADEVRHRLLPAPIRPDSDRVQRISSMCTANSGARR